MLFRGMDRAALDAAYNNTAAVGIPKRDQYVGGWSARSDALRKTREAKADLRYGSGPRQRLDFFPCGQTGAPTLAYIHGGYWQLYDTHASSRRNYSILRGNCFRLSLRFRTNAVRRLF
jgi:acetyl esterase/lipase